MGTELVSQLQAALEKIPWPEIEAATAQGRKVYEVGLEKVNAYRSDPKVLGAALRTFQTSDSRPYALAGAAYALVAASREADGTYAPAGLEAALEWLEKAQDLEPDRVDINMIEALIYVHGGRDEDARLVLNYLHNQDPNDYHVHMAEVKFWLAQGDMEKAIEWGQKAMDVATTVPQRMRLWSVLADCYLQQGKEEKALETYREALHFSPKNADLWHKVSFIYWGRGAVEEAVRFNAKVLELEPSHAEARRLRATMEENDESQGLMGRLFGR